MANIQLVAALLSLLAINSSVLATKINVRNECSYVVTACDRGPNQTNATCYALQGGYTRERDVGASWNGGMIWEFQIAADTAQGFTVIIHLDVKPQNILLDDQFRAKVADFGMSKLFDRDLTEVETKMRGTPGYLAPEWLLQTAITEKCDVYSYGMVLLELVSGRKNIDLTAAVEKWYFPAWAVDRMQIQSWDEILDERLKGKVSAEEWEQVKKVVRIAMWCIQDKPRTRPSMAEVMQMLEGGGSEGSTSGVRFSRCGFRELVFYLESPARVPVEQQPLPEGAISRS